MAQGTAASSSVLDESENGDWFSRSIFEVDWLIFEFTVGKRSKILEDMWFTTTGF